MDSKEQELSCVEPATGIISDPEPSQDENQTPTRSAAKMTARVGAPAPDFELSAYADGTFKNIRLSDYLGKWVVVCFYPGDFTFV